jgi:TolB-like protein/tetratricopeptide (TPR) repeat protein
VESIGGVLARFSLSQLVKEARRRRVFRVAGVYVVAAWVVLQVTDLLFESWGISSVALQHVWLGAILGFPVALVLGWRYDIAGGRVVRSVGRDADADLSIGRADFIILTAVAAVFVAIVYTTAIDVSDTVDSDVTQGATSAVVANSVAVLPFVNMSGDPDNEYFSDGLSETLLHMLAQIPELKVSARTSSFAFKGKDQDIRAIAAALGVAHVLEGSVQRAGGQVRITAQLIRAEDGFHVWSENYDRTLQDIFGIQDEIAQRVSTNLTRSLLDPDVGVEIQGIGTDSVEAYDLYLRAVAEQNHASYESIRTSEGLLKDAIAADQDFHSAKTQLVSNYFLQVEAGLRRPREAVAESIALLEQVLAAIPGDVRARTWMLVYRTVSANLAGEEVDFEVVKDSMRNLTVEAPSEVEPKKLLLQVLSQGGETDEALALMQEILVLDPLNSGMIREIGQAYMRMEDWPNARKMLNRSLEIDPAQPYPYQILAFIDQATGDTMGFVRNYLRAIELDPQDYGYAARLANFLYYLGLDQEGDNFRDRSIAIAPTSSHARRMELVREVRFGTPENSLAVARQMLEDRVDMHSSAWEEAAFELFAISEKLKESRSALEFVEKTFPGFSDYAQPVSIELTVLRLSALSAFFQLESSEEFQQRLDQLDYVLNELLINGGGPVLRARVLALRGDTQAAIDVALTEIFDKPAISHVGNLDRLFELGFMADVAADPRIREALKVSGEEKAKAAEEVRSYLANVELM